MVKNIMSFIYDSLIEARDLLTSKNWNKGTYFSVKKNTLCMCAHGALQSKVNPAAEKIVIYFIGDKNLANHGERFYSAIAAKRRHRPAALAFAAAVAATAAAARRALHAGLRHEPAHAAILASVAGLTPNAEDDAAVRAAPGIAAQKLWEMRPDWVRYNDKDYGSLDAHYLLGLVGCTTAFNDDPSTTLEMVKEKFTEAANLAQSLGI